MNTVHLLCAGAAKGLVLAVQAEFEAAHGASLIARFGAVGAMKEALLAGAPCDLMVVTAKMIDELAAAGHLRGASGAAIGKVRTGIAVPAGAALPDVSSVDALKSALLAASALYFPDPARATAGIHFAEVLRQLGIHDLLAPRFRTFAQGALAMHALAACGDRAAIGCTQITEINYTDGVTLAGALPARFELATLYSAAVASAAAEPALAARLLDSLSGDASLALRRHGGFEF